MAIHMLLPVMWNDAIGFSSVVRCTCGPMGPTAASGHEERCPLYTRTANLSCVTLHPFEHQNDALRT